MPAKKVSKEEAERIMRLKKKYETRITIARHAKESLDAGDYPGALKKFIEYLSIIREINDLETIYDLKIHMFDAKKDLTEMLMISHIYFEMARLYDAVPKFQDDAKKCLEQFVHFSANQPYQVVNSEMIRKYLKKSIFKNPEMFRNSYLQIYVQSKKCYVVSFCYGENHPITNECRNFKDWLIDRKWGFKLVENYYYYSPLFLEWLDQHQFFKPLFKFVSKTCLRIFASLIIRRLKLPC
jgi:tetratricopeptide (TPR) repeat protein